MLAPVAARSALPLLLASALLGSVAARGDAQASRESARPAESIVVPRDGFEHPEMFASRRAEFLRRLGEGVAVFHAKPEYERNNDVEFLYRQDSDFYYLTGFEEPEAVAVLSSTGHGPAYTLFVRPRDPTQEIWNGFRWGAEGAKKTFRVDAAYVLDSLPSVMPRLLKDAPKLLYSSAGEPEFGGRLRDWARAAGVLGGSGEVGPSPAAPQADEGPTGSFGFESPVAITHEMRLILSAEEIARVQRAIDITELAHRATMRAAAPGLHEYDLEALQYYVYRVSGAERFGFPSIVGSGPNSVTLHYRDNNRRLGDGETMVVDIGAEYAMYTADVTRTIPVSGTFSPEQREVYQIIADAQDEAMKLMRPGHTIAESSKRAAEVVTAGLVRLGLLKGSVEENLASGAYRQFYMHGLSHWIGLDVHDPAPYTEADGSPRKFQPGMVLSNEPGIYIRSDIPGVDSKWHNIGVRLENDVLITRGDAVDMTARIPRSIADVEAEMRKPPITIGTGESGASIAEDLTPGAAVSVGRVPSPRSGKSKVAVGRVAAPDEGKAKVKASR
ncbi:MAG: aminopeptidase P N-terminal domain-containing protein [Gemmatimonadetes bacterium]|nr:aminopeptidase P N-terminal domain-containing protein [Gemmatimonadota bacterium]